ncbi:hypothetical protein [Streptomyces cinnamoneus]|uniref:Uncharacterized protein n=1 Tax=Streptomyces cinnamoneus TaxID=53446 RepID=A0A918TX29_STRCJ|nr:hypothetical protein [Streptomyces cinnamoneus]GHC65598.1 hypothetical protein GCM10010507_49080 [Streptomyces cinnamoneus]
MTDAQIPQQSKEAHILLASAGSGGGGGGDVHKASVWPWTTAGGVAGELNQGMDTALRDLSHAHDGIKSGTAGFASAAALSAILGGWEARLSAVRDECKRLDGDLKKAGTAFGENEVQVKASFQATGSRINDYNKPWTPSVSKAGK